MQDKASTLKFFSYRNFRDIAQVEQSMLGLGAGDKLKLHLEPEDAFGLFNEALAKRGYHKSAGSPDFVVLFVPFETLLAEALRIDPAFLEKAFKLNVTIATPTSMMALLRTIGYIFTRNKLADNADEIQKVANTFLKNITLLHGKIVAVGKAISSTAKAYEDLIPTAEKTVLSPARRIHNLGVAGDKDKLAIEYPESPGAVRELRSISAEDDFIEVEEIEADDK